MLFCHMKPERVEFVRKGLERLLTLFFVRFYRFSASDNATDESCRLSTYSQPLLAPTRVISTFLSLILTCQLKLKDRVCFPTK